MDAIKIVAPATMANLACAFDVLGYSRAARIIDVVEIFGTTK